MEKIALITGAARRVGADCVRAMHWEGFSIALHFHRSLNEARLLAAELNHVRPDSVHLIEADLCDVQQIDRMIRDVLEIWGRLDVLVNNASCFFPTKIDEATEMHFDKIMATNLKGPFFLAQAAHTALAEQKGSLVNISDVHGSHPLRHYSLYCMSQAALNMMTQSLAKEWGPEVRVNAIAPGCVLWPEGENAFTEYRMREIIGKTALQRAGNPKAIAKAVLYLVQDADYVTGQVLTVDGGRY